MRRRLLIATGLVLSLSGVAVTAGGAYAYFWDRSNADLIASGITIAGIDVGGLHAAQARAVLDATLVRPLQRPLRVEHDNQSFVIRPANAGLRVDVAHMVDAAVRLSRAGGIGDRVLRTVRRQRVDESIPLRAALSNASLGIFVDRVALVVGRPAQAARVVPGPTKLRIVPSRDGLAVRRALLRRALVTSLLSPSERRTVEVPTRVVQPRWTTASLAKRYPTFIVVSRETFTLRLFKHLKLARTYRIAVGQAGLETPSGLYEINNKQVNPSWHVPLSAWAGDLAGRIIPPGPADPIKSRWMGFWDGAGIHGTDQESSIGSAASHGCIRMTIPDVEALYPLVPLHTPIYVG
jgi:L,D-transpeptidase catalytic domain/Putative peptidoglycan binding domain